MILLSNLLFLAWSNACKQNKILSDLNEAINKLVTLVQHKYDLQTKLPVKIQPGPKMRAWRGLMEKF